MVSSDLLIKLTLFFFLLLKKITFAGTEDYDSYMSFGEDTRQLTQNSEAVE